MFQLKKFCNLVLLFGVLALISMACSQEGKSPKEIPFTTSSDEAKQLFLEGLDYFDKLKFPQAAEMFEKAIAIDENFAMAYLYRASSGGGNKVFRDNLSKAVNLIDKVSIGEKHQILYAQANANNNEVIRKQELDNLLNLFPEDKRAHYWASLYYYFIVVNYQKALDELNKVIALDSSFAAAYNQLGYVNIELGDLGAAEKAFNKYIKLIPDEANPYDSYAEFLLRQGRYDESIEQYNKAFNTDTDFVTALAGMGDNYIFKGDFNKAREYYQQYYDKAFNINQKLGALYYKAVSLVYENKIDDAIKVFDEYSKIALENNSPTSAIAGYRYSAWVLAHKDKIDNMEKYINKAEDLVKNADLNEADRRTYEIYVGLDKSYLRTLKKDFKEAEKELGDLKKTIQTRQDPVETELLNFVYGILQFKKGDYNKALEYLDKANKESPNVWHWQAMALEQTGKIQEANKLYSQISNYNVNGLALALVREKAKNKL